MSDSPATKSTLTPILKWLKIISLLLMVLWIAQTYLNPPERRAVAACYPPYSVARLFMVKIPSALNPGDPSIIRWSMSAAKFNRWCIDTAPKLPFIDEPTHLRGETEARETPGR